jgi:hypothetical protein
VGFLVSGAIYLSLMHLAPATARKLAGEET